MSKSALMRSCDVRAILRVVGECREQGDDRIAWREHLIASLSRLVDADLAVAGEMQGCHTGVVKDLGVTPWMQAGIGDPAVIESALHELRRDPTWNATILE